MLQQGNLGLCKALKTFDPSLGKSFTSYANLVVERNIMDTNAFDAPCGTTFYYKFYIPIKKMQKYLYEKSGRYPTVKEIAEETEFNEKVVSRVINDLDRKPIYIDEPISENDERTVGDMINSKSFIPGQNYDEPEILSKAIKIINSNKLTELEKNVLLLHCNGKNYEQIAQSLNTHVKSIDNALQRALRKLRKEILPSKSEKIK